MAFSTCVSAPSLCPPPGSAPPGGLLHLRQEARVQEGLTLPGSHTGAQQRPPSKPNLGPEPHSWGPEGTEQVRCQPAEERLLGHRAAPHAAACVFQGGPRPRPPQGSRATGSRAMISPHPCNRHLSVRLKPQASKCQCANPAPSQYLGGLLLICVVFSPSLLRQMAD